MKTFNFQAQHTHTPSSIALVRALVDSRDDERRCCNRCVASIAGRTAGRGGGGRAERRSLVSTERSSSMIRRTLTKRSNDFVSPGTLGFGSGGGRGPRNVTEDDADDVDAVVVVVDVDVDVVDDDDDEEDGVDVVDVVVVFVVEVVAAAAVGAVESTIVSRRRGTESYTGAGIEAIFFGASAETRARGDTALPCLRGDVGAADLDTFVVEVVEVVEVVCVVAVAVAVAAVEVVPPMASSVGMRP